MRKNFDRKWWCHFLDEMKHGLNTSNKIIAQSSFSTYSIQSWWNEESDERLWFEGVSSWRKLTVYFYLDSFQEERGIIDDNTDRVSDDMELESIFSDALGFDITGFVSVAWSLFLQNHFAKLLISNRKRELISLILERLIL